MEWKKSDWFIMGLGTLIIVCFYMMVIPKIYAVWNLVDEYGYLANAAYLSGTGWEAMTNFYYGYGYSLWLIPFFWICSGGITIIRGAMVVNTIFIVLLFWIQYLLMSKIYKGMNRKMIALISFALCFYPYLVVSNWKVVCECLLTLMIWICGLVLYQALDTGKWYWYALLGLAVVYTFFVHIRAFVFCIILLFAVGVMFLQKKVSVKNLLILIITSGVLLILGTMLKNHIIDVMYTNIPGGVAAEEIGNTLTISYILEKFIGFFRELSIVEFDSLACKVFYLFVATAGILPLGIYAVMKDSIQTWRREKELTKESIIQLMYAVAVLGMVVALVVNPMGEGEGTGYYFYARYYEYLMGPAIFAGAAYCMSKKLRVSEILGLVAVLAFFSWFATDIADYFEIYEHEVYVHTGHMPAISYIVQFYNWFEKVIEVGAKVTVVALLLLFVVAQLKKLRWCIPIGLLALFMLSNIWNIKFIVKINGDNLAEYQVANYVYQNYDVDEICFLNKDTNDLLAYTKIQSLLGPVKVNVVDPKDVHQIQENDLVVTSAFNSYVEELEDHEMVWAYGCYEIYSAN